MARSSQRRFSIASFRFAYDRHSDTRKSVLKNKTAERSIHPPTANTDIAYAVIPTIAPIGNSKDCARNAYFAVLDNATGARRTKRSAGKICASVRAAWLANAASKPANCAGAEDDGGVARATTRRATTATAITMQIQNPARSKSGAGLLWRAMVSIVAMTSLRPFCHLPP